MLTDTHAHLYWDSFQEDFDQMIKRAIDAGVNTIINVGVDLEKSKTALEQVQGKLSGIQGLLTYSTIGIHPHEAIMYTDDFQLDQAIGTLEAIYKSNPEKVVAVGECGLDFFFEHNPGFNPSNFSEDTQKELQKRLLQKQIELSKKLNLPLLIHCRDDRSKNPQNSECWDEVIKMTKDHFGIYHCYSGLPQTTRTALKDTRFYISFAGNLTYPKNLYLQETAKQIPLERIVLETDSPFLPPQTSRGKRNEPANVAEVARLIANLKGIPLEEVSKKTSENAAKVFAFRG